VKSEMILGGEKVLFIQDIQKITLERQQQQQEITFRIAKDSLSRNQSQTARRK
jgi:hypothetical protein